MSGCGRKHRAKHLTRQYLDADAWHGPREGESLAICMESPHGQHLRVLLLTFPEAGDKDSLLFDVEKYVSETVVTLPGKFHKVIWLSIKDVVVVQDGSVVLKPSPEQLTNFLKGASAAHVRKVVEAAQEMALDQRRAVERMPLYTKTTVTTTSVLVTEEEARAHAAAKEVDDAGELREESDADSLEELVNLNRGTIKHRHQFFYGLEDEEDDDDEEEEDEEEECL